uniref:CCHC-type domain-containing protein n=1 Tax=Chromera velia CCMP2878 TaxID=1169474 RepID=A0A0G4HBL1_9ALVE|eukprot:Cvel_6223.t1-p1 / transcript=Cvel_6223.t1 / gene=Cvel_6223 / organism=Chromera_velia_CCMP2878 / gene_product=hypothetical protein / transcript_product=hypothetical protein / location=Cvel_scaffold301:28463-29161(+) / protein_length=233 / sequence_SO=supercontig / SO=protein_coding / is_pseudo=false
MTNALEKKDATYQDTIAALEKHFGQDALAALVSAAFAFLNFASDKEADPCKRLTKYNTVFARVPTKEWEPDGFTQLLMIVRGLSDKYRETIYQKMKEKYGSRGGNLLTLDDLRGEIKNLGTAKAMGQGKGEEGNQEFGARTEKKKPLRREYDSSQSEGNLQRQMMCFHCGCLGHFANKCELTEEKLKEKREMDAKFLQKIKAKKEKGEEKTCTEHAQSARAYIQAGAALTGER